MGLAPLWSPIFEFGTPDPTLQRNGGSLFRPIPWRHVYKMSGQHCTLLSFFGIKKKETKGSFMQIKKIASHPLCCWKGASNSYCRSKLPISCCRLKLQKKGSGIVALARIDDSFSAIPGSSRRDRRRSSNMATRCRTAEPRRFGRVWSVGHDWPCYRQAREFCLLEKKIQTFC